MVERKSIEPRLLLGLCAGALAIGIFTSLYQREGESNEFAAEVVEDAERYLVPVTASQPSIGPSDALVTIIEWCDLRGQACRSIDPIRTTLVEKYGSSLRWVYRHLPDRAKADSMLLHRVARGVDYYGSKFWEFRAEVIDRDAKVWTEAKLRPIVEGLGVEWSGVAQGLERDGFDRHIAADLVFASRYGAEVGRPTFFVNGRRLTGVPVAKLEPTLTQIIDRELVEAKALVAKGVSPSNVYEELTKYGKWSVGDDPVKREAERLAEGK